MEVKGWRLREKDGSYTVVVDWVDDRNVRHQRSRTLGQVSEQDARESALDFFYRLKSGVEPIKKETPLGFYEYSERYFKGRLDRHEYERSTYYTNLKHLRAWRVALGNKKIGSLSPSDIRRAIEKWFADGRDATTVDKRITCLQEVCRFAFEEHEISSNPFERIKRPRKTQRELNGVNDSSMLKRVSEGIRNLPLDSYKVAYMLALYTGMRRGEICALEWKDIDLDRGEIWIRSSIGDDGEKYKKSPKSGKARDVAVPETLKETLELWLMESAFRYGRTSYVVVREDGSRMDPDYLTHSFTDLARFNGWVGAAGRRLTMHDLRHTAATYLINGNADIKTVQSVMGHSSAAVTLDMYASPDRDAKKKAAALLDRI